MKKLSKEYRANYNLFLNYSIIFILPYVIIQVINLSLKSDLLDSSLKLDFIYLVFYGLWMASAHLYLTKNSEDFFKNINKKNIHIVENLSIGMIIASLIFDAESLYNVIIGSTILISTLIILNRGYYEIEDKEK